jgi:SAM-dependent methyltransferase
VLEIGCGAGAFTRRLAGLADRILALDVAPSAIARARASPCGPAAVEFAVANVMDFGFRDAAPFDLIVMSETIYYLGWLYPFFDVAWLAGELFEASTEGGRLLLADTLGGGEDALMRPPIIHSYRALFANAGYRLAAQPTFRGEKNGVGLEVLISLFEKPGG